MLGSITRRRHVVLFVYKSWGMSIQNDGGRALTAFAVWTGQIRPLCDLAAHMVKLRAIVVTLFTTATFYDRVQNELRRSFAAEDIHRMLYIRYVLAMHNLSAYVSHLLIMSTESLPYTTIAATRSTTGY